MSEGWMRGGLFALAGVLLAILLGCNGNVGGLEATLALLERADDYGGAFVRLYGTERRDTFEAVDYAGERLTVVGSTTSDDGADGLVLQIESTGEIIGQRRFFGADGAGGEEESFVDLSVAPAEYTGGSARLVVGGWRGTPPDGTVLQLRTDGSGPTAASRFGGTSSVERVVGVVATSYGILAVGNTDGFGQDAIVLANIEYNSTDGAASYHYYFEDGDRGNLRLLDAVSFESDVLLAGRIDGGPGGRDVFLGHFSQSWAGFLSATAFDLGGDEEARAVAQTYGEGTEGVVLVGTTTAFFDSAESWFVLFLKQDLSITSGYAMNFERFGDDGPADLYVLGREDRYGDGYYFLIVGSQDRAIFMDTSGEILWASEEAPETHTGLINADLTGGAEETASRNGFVVVGTSSSDAHGSRQEEGVAFWLQGNDGSAFPSLEATQDYAVEEITPESVTLRDVMLTRHADFSLSPDPTNATEAVAFSSYDSDGSLSLSITIPDER